MNDETTPRTDAKAHELWSMDALEALSEMTRHAEDFETELSAAEAKIAELQRSPAISTDNQALNS